MTTREIPKVTVWSPSCSCCSETWHWHHSFKRPSEGQLFLGNYFYIHKRSEPPGWAVSVSRMSYIPSSHCPSLQGPLSPKAIPWCFRCHLHKVLPGTWLYATEPPKEAKETSEAHPIKISRDAEMGMKKNTDFMPVRASSLCERNLWCCLGAKFMLVL